MDMDGANGTEERWTDYEEVALVDRSVDPYIDRSVGGRIAHWITNLQSPIDHWSQRSIGQYDPGLILGLRPANERRRYKVTPSLIGWAQT